MQGGNHNLRVDGGFFYEHLKIGHDFSLGRSIISTFPGNLPSSIGAVGQLVIEATDDLSGFNSVTIGGQELFADDICVKN